MLVSSDWRRAGNCLMEAQHATTASLSTTCHHISWANKFKRQYENQCTRFTSWVLLNQLAHSLCHLQAMGKESTDRASRCTSSCPSILWCWPAFPGCKAGVLNTTRAWSGLSASESHERRGKQQPVGSPLRKCRQWTQKQRPVLSLVL